MITKFRIGQVLVGNNTMFTGCYVFTLNHSLAVPIGISIDGVKAVRSTEDGPDTRIEKLPTVPALKVVTIRT